MRNMTQTISVPPRIGSFLTQITEVPDVEAALFKVLREYVDLKTETLKQRIRVFESKWKMSFKEFSEHGDAETPGFDLYSYEVESDFWEWEQAETLLKHYDTVKLRRM